MALRARCLSIGSLRRWRSLERGWRSGRMRLYAEMACARPANVGPGLATLICSASTFRRPFNSQAAQQSRLEEEGSASVNKLATRLAVPGRLSAARPAERRRCSFLHLLWRAMHRIDKSSKHGRGRAMPKWKCPLRCQQGWQCAVLMAWTGRHNSNSACAHSQPHWSSTI